MVWQGGEDLRGVGVPKWGKSEKRLHQYNSLKGKTPSDVKKNRKNS